MGVHNSTEPSMSKSTGSFYVYGAPVSFLVACYRHRLNQRLLVLSFPQGHTAQIIQLADWKASKAMPN
jgi:hypothetical protein